MSKPKEADKELERIIFRAYGVSEDFELSPLALELIKDIKVFVDKAVVAELEKLDKVPNYPLASERIRDRLQVLKASSEVIK